FTLEASGDFRISRDVGQENFDRHTSLELQVESAVDDRHGATADLPIDRDLSGEQRSNARELLVVVTSRLLGRGSAPRAEHRCRGNHGAAETTFSLAVFSHYSWPRCRCGHRTREASGRSDTAEQMRRANGV